LITLAKQKTFANTDEDNQNDAGWLTASHPAVQSRVKRIMGFNAHYPEMIKSCYAQTIFTFGKYHAIPSGCLNSDLIYMGPGENNLRMIID
jgi:hypothetical protein